MSGVAQLRALAAIALAVSLPIAFVLLVIFRVSHPADFPQGAMFRDVRRTFGKVGGDDVPLWVE